MNTLRKLVSCSIVAFLASCCSAPLVDGASAAPDERVVVFTPSAPAVLEVKRARTGHLLVRPRIDGQDAGYWIFDSGAGMCCVSTPALASMALQEADSIEASGIGGTARAKTYRATRLELGPLLLRDHPMLATDLSFLTESLGETIQGVVGYGVLAHCVVEFDFVQGQLALFDPATYRLTGAKWQALDLTGRTPAIRATIEGHEGLFQIDTGQNSAVVCSAATVDAWRLLDREGLRDAKVGGVGGDVKAQAGTLAWVEFAGVRRERVDAIFLREAKGSRSASSRQGALGAALLRDVVMITDYRQQRIAFRARS